MGIKVTQGFNRKGTELMENYAPIAWLIATIVFSVAEAMTVQLISIWFAAGSLVALIASMLGAPLPAQFGLFFLGTAVLLVATRPLAKKLMGVKRTATNADMVIGEIGIVEQDIDNNHQTGRVFVNGLSWAARSEDDSTILAEQKVIVKRIEGAKIYVELKKQ